MSYDFAALVPEFVTSRADAARLHAAMCEDVLEPAPAVVADFVAELEGRYGVDVDRDVGFMMVDSSPDARGTVVCTSWQTVGANARALLELTRDHGLLLYDPQRDRLYDPRHRVDAEVSLGNAVWVPYLSETLLVDYFANPEPESPFLIVERVSDEDHYAQAYLHADGRIDVEHRAGGPDDHYAAQTTDAALARRILWQWATGADGWRTAIEWERIAV